MDEFVRSNQQQLAGGETKVNSRRSKAMHDAARWSCADQDRQRQPDALLGGSARGPEAKTKVTGAEGSPIKPVRLCYWGDRPGFLLDALALLPLSSQ